MKLLALVSMLLALVTHTAGANPLYQWIEKDGTPTFSPDPPPKGVDYTIVGPDLEPLTGQPVPSITPQAAQPASSVAKPAPVASNLAAPVVLTPAPQDVVQPVKKPKSKWKPVQYADDPNPQRVRTPATTGSTTTSASITAPLTRVSDECLRIKQQQLILESQFAGAHNPQDMDQAILKLNRFNKEIKGTCGY